MYHFCNGSSATTHVLRVLKGISHGSKSPFASTRLKYKAPKQRDLRDEREKIHLVFPEIIRAIHG